MNINKVKQESFDILLHVAAETDTEHRVSKIQAIRPDYLPVHSTSKLDSFCPSCQCQLSINIIVYDTNETSSQFSEVLTVKTEPIYELIKEETVGSNDEFHNFPENSSRSPSPEELNENAETRVLGKRKKVKEASKLRGNSEGGSKVTREKKKRKTNPLGQTCVYCFERIPGGEDGLKQHYYVHVKTCKFCQTEFKSKWALQLHTRKVHFDKHPKYSSATVCPFCNRNFSREGFGIHQRTCKEPVSNVDEEPVCNVCNKTFSKRSYLTRHIEIVHEGKKDFACEICGLQFSSKNLFDEHSLTHIWNDPKPYKCHHCPEVAVKTRFLIKNHMRDKHSSTPKKMFKCKEPGCTRAYSVSNKLKNHLNTHLNIRKFHCSFCSKSFYTKGAMQYHEGSHRDERPFPCEVCGHRFRTRSYLNTHMRLHTGEKPYQCSICQQRFSDRGCYRSHVMRHEKELGVTLDKGVKKFATKPPTPNTTN